MSLWPCSHHGSRPNFKTQVFEQLFAPWDGDFVLGTDQPYRDMLTQLIYGARNLTGVSFAATLLCFARGVTLGLMAAMDVAGST